VPNFICVALALRDAGHAAVGIRLDSGDLAYLSKEARAAFRAVDARVGSSLARCAIVASNDINEAVLLSLADQGHEIDVFGIGTHLVTCQAQPALGMVFKLVEVNGTPRIKLSQDAGKVTIPGSKEAFRLIGGEGVPLIDLLVRAGEARPAPGRRVLCRHPFDEKKRV
jgi:nicotinate phosphoribosyltransferase